MSMGIRVTMPPGYVPNLAGPLVVRLGGAAVRPGPGQPGHAPLLGQQQRQPEDGDDDYQHKGKAQPEFLEPLPAGQPGHPNAGQQQADDARPGEGVVGAHQGLGGGGDMLQVAGAVRPGPSRKRR